LYYLFFYTTISFISVQKNQLSLSWFSSSHDSSLHYFASGSKSFLEHATEKPLYKRSLNSRSPSGT